MRSARIRSARNKVPFKGYFIKTDSLINHHMLYIKKMSSDDKFLDNSTTLQLFQIPCAYHRVFSCVKTCGK
jgi:hypothetical protein